ncbi:MAG: hypothetical protein DI566_04910 [Microbacterium sp.]|nr:MAG: hypothetical protein DI566_04910 [Microbacterium sp.]
MSTPLLPGRRVGSARPAGTALAASAGAWAAPALAVGALVIASLVVGSPAAADPLTGSIAWRVGMPLALAATSGIAIWCRLSVSARLARWIWAAALAAGGYWLGAAAASAIAAAGATDSLAYTLVATIPAGAWTVVLAVLQCAAVVAGQEAGCLGRRSWPTVTLLGAAGVMLLATLISAPPDVAPASILPASVVASPVFVAVTSALLYGWMLSLLVLPVTMFVLAARSRATARRARARIAVGALCPLLVVLLCGLLAAVLRESEWRGDEATWLAIGFALALPLTCGWLAATVREATAEEGGWFTSLATALRGALWALYVLGVVQLVTNFTPLLGGDAAAGAVAMALVLATTFWPWLLLVRAAVRRFDVRTAVAEAAVAAVRPDGGAVGLAEPAGPACERVAAEALSDPDVRVLLARPGGRWIAADGTPSSPAEQVATLTVTDATGLPLGVVEHRTRFADLRPLALALRPLFERAVWEAELREQAGRVAAERARADAAASEARRRIERDLHDGVQGRLVSLGLGLSIAREQLPDALARDVVANAVAELQASVAELRELASGALSSRLDGRGLAGAVGELVARAPVPVEVDIPDLALPPGIESTAYFVIAEAVTNALKHGDAATIAVRVVHDALVDTAVGTVTVEIWDDGRGGADARAGTGLRGLRERVRAAGGRLVVSERMPQGTRVEAVLPCGS